MRSVCKKHRTVIVMYVEKDICDGCAGKIFNSDVQCVGMIYCDFNINLQLSDFWGFIVRFYNSSC